MLKYILKNFHDEQVVLLQMFEMDILLTEHILIAHIILIIIKILIIII